jgi:hypothetical protein
MLLVKSALSPRPVLDGCVDHEGAVGLQDLEGAVSSAFHVSFLKSGESKPWPEMALLTETRDTMLYWGRM